jgi:hypothetical protein
MTYRLIPHDVGQFIIDNIESIAELEGLLLLSRSPEAAYTAADLAAGLYTDQQQAEQVLEHLHSTGFLASEGKDITAYRYQPRTPELSEMVGRLSEVYSQYLIPVTNLIHSKSRTKIQKFADAFKIRKEVDK